jgi:hypothetical protein
MVMERVLLSCNPKKTWAKINKILKEISLISENLI